jgi:ABC-2 type transport system permease protein
MTDASAYLSAAGGIFRRDLLLFVSYRLRFLSQILSAVFGVAFFYFISRLVSAPSVGTADDYFAFVVVGMVVLPMLTSTLVAMPASIRQELVAGTFERVLLSPLGPVQAILSMTIFPFVSSAISGFVVLVLAAAVFGLTVEWTTVPLAIPVSLLGLLAFVPFGLLVSAGVVVLKQAAAGASFLLTCILLVGGVFFPVSLLPGWLEWAALVQPFTPALELLRHLLVGTPVEGSPWTAVWKLVVFIAVLAAPSLWLLRAAIRLGQRRGTITEY